MRGQVIEPPFDTTVYEATFGAPVTVEYCLTKESETSFFDNVLSINLILSNAEQLAQFISLHPWFCQHVVFVWKLKQKTHNVMLTTFNHVEIEPGNVIICGVHIQPVDTLTACSVIEESRNTIESYDGSGASELKAKHDARKYFESGILPRLDI